MIGTRFLSSFGTRFSTTVGIILFNSIVGSRFTLIDGTRFTLVVGTRFLTTVGTRFLSMNFDTFHWFVPDSYHILFNARFASIAGARLYLLDSNRSPPLSCNRRISKDSLSPPARESARILSLLQLENLQGFSLSSS